MEEFGIKSWTKDDFVMRKTDNYTVEGVDYFAASSYYLITDIIINRLLPV